MVLARSSHLRRDAAVITCGVFGISMGAVSVMPLNAIQAAALPLMQQLVDTCQILRRVT